MSRLQRFSPAFLLAVCAGLLFALPAAAAVLARVDAVQAPAWLTRGDTVLPLTPGMEVRNSDRIATGADGRAYVQLAEGSTVKLGANTQFTFYSQSRRPAENFRGALDIASGAFRYTTGLLGKLRSRDLQVRVGTSTIGIRGTDVWGRASATEDMAVLIEGQVEVRRGAESVTLDRPLSQYRALRGGEVQPVENIAYANLVMLARETDIRAGDGAISVNGRWKLKFAQVATQDEALAIYDVLRNGGYAARIKVAKRDGAISYTPYVGGLPNPAEAAAVAARIKAQLRLDSSVSK